MSTENDLEYEYQKLIPSEQKRLRFIDIALLLSVAAITLYVVMLTYASHDNQVKSILNGIAIILLILVLVFSKKGSKDEFSQKDRLFFVFYKTHKELLNYIGFRNKGNEHKAKIRIIALSRFLMNWARKKAPPEVISISKEIALNLRNKVLPTINHEKIITLVKISDAFLQIATSINKVTFNEKNFEEFNNFLTNLSIEKKENRIKKFLFKYRYIEYVYLILIVTVIYIGVNQLYPDSLLDGIVGFIAFMITICFLLHNVRKRSN